MEKIHGNSTYTEELAEEICDAIACSSFGLKKLCTKNPAWPKAEIIYGWLRRHPTFAHQYAKAKLAQITIFMDEITEISDDDHNDTTVDDHGNERCHSEWIARSRLRVDTRKWLASKLVPKTYGMKSIDIGIEGSLMEKIIDKL